jgi:undecaprenyl-diphosphatase
MIALRSHLSTARHWLAWVRAHKHFALLLLLSIIATGVWAFVGIAEEVVEGDTQQFDEWAVRALRRADDPATPIGPTFLHEIGRDLTALGGVFVCTLVTLGVCGYLLMIRKYHAMWLVVGATLGGLLISTILKHSFGRERPDIVPHLSHVYTSSFPSGHAMLSAVVYLTLGSLLARFVPHRAVKVYLLMVALMLTLLIGVSRVYMGVHYPTDVLAGWTAGLVWATICYLVARRLQIQGTVERDVDEPGGAEAKRESEQQAAANRGS